MQRPQRRRRQRREEKVAWLRGLGRAEDVWPVAQEASAEEMVAVLAAYGGGRKKKMQKKRICREEREDLAMVVPIAGEDLSSWGG
jgi:hypothetical protein